MYHKMCTVWSHEALSKDVLLLEISAPEIVAEAKPGQFVYLKLNGSLDPLLRRPLSIHKIDEKQGRLWLLYQIRGRGTAQFALLREGDAVDVIGPIGKGFNLEIENAPYLLIGGGMGMAPFSFTAQYLTQNNIPWKAIIGARSEKELYTKSDFISLGQEAIVTTDDGSLGFHGTTVEAAAKLLENTTFKNILACGPHPMLRALSKLGKDCAIPVQVSLEARMACGVGACLGCTVKKAVSSGYYKVCKDGPVFYSDEVDLDA